MPASGFAGWQGRCFAATPRFSDGRRPTTCSWRRSPELHRALETVQPESPRHFYNLAATQIRRVLIDLSRRYYGAEGLGSHHDTAAQNAGGGYPSRDTNRRTHRANPQASWNGRSSTSRSDALPEEEREVFNLVWYEQ